MKTQKGVSIEQAFWDFEQQRKRAVKDYQKAMEAAEEGDSIGAWQILETMRANLAFGAQRVIDIAQDNVIKTARKARS